MIVADFRYVIKVSRYEKKYIVYLVDKSTVLLVIPALWGMGLQGIALERGVIGALGIIGVFIAAFVCFIYSFRFGRKAAEYQSPPQKKVLSKALAASVVYLFYL